MTSSETDGHFLYVQVNAKSGFHEKVTHLSLSSLLSDINFGLSLLNISPKYRVARTGNGIL